MACINLKTGSNEGWSSEARQLLQRDKPSTIEPNNIEAVRPGKEAASGLQTWTKRLVGALLLVISIGLIVENNIARWKLDQPERELAKQPSTSEPSSKMDVSEDLMKVKPTSTMGVPDGVALLDAADQSVPKISDQASEEASATTEIVDPNSDIPLTFGESSSPGPPPLSSATDLKSERSYATWSTGSEKGFSIGLSEDEQFLHCQRERLDDPDFANWIIEATDKGLCFEKAESVTVECAEILAQHPYPLSLEGLKYLEVGVAEALALHKSELRLSGLKSITNTAAKALAKFQGKRLVLDELVDRSDSSYDDLVSLTGLLQLEFRTETISDGVKHEVRDFKREREGVNFNSLNDHFNSECFILNDAAHAEMLTGEMNELRFPQAIAITVECAEILAQHQYPLSLGGLKDLPAKVATALAEHKSELRLSGLQTITPEAARALAKYQGKRLVLDGLDGFTPELESCFQNCNAEIMFTAPDKSLAEGGAGQ